MRLATLMVEAQTVVAYRMMGMAGIWSVTAYEKQRMVSEKPAAFIEGATAATLAIMRAEPTHAVLEAAIQPLERKATSNRKRLAKRGFRK